MRATRERILDAAAALMRGQGLARATTKAIALSVGVSEPALYRHFASKEELFLAVLRERLPPFIDTLKDLPGRIGKGRLSRTLEEIALTAIGFFGETIPLAGSIFSETDLLARHQAAVRQGRMGPQLAVPALASYLTAEADLGRLPRGLDTVAAAAMLIGACFHRAFVTRFFGEPAPAAEDQRFAKQIVKALLRK
jgi:AcrR family transcriptional regulator